MKKALVHLVIGILTTLISSQSLADFDPNETFIYPSGLPTAETLRKGEWHLAPPPWGWVAYGFTKDFTFAWDYPAGLVAGIPAILARYRILNSGASQLAIENYLAQWTYTYQDKRKDEYILEHRDSTYWARLVWTQKITERFRIHVFVGSNFSDYERYMPHKKEVFPVTTYDHQWTPNYGLDLDWPLSPWCQLHVNYAYGNSFYNVDQVNKKYTAFYSFVMSPFSVDAAKFFSRMRIEMSGGYAKVIDPDVEYKLQLPLLPYIYWQFGAD